MYRAGLYSIYCLKGNFQNTPALEKRMTISVGTINSLFMVHMKDLLRTSVLLNMNGLFLAELWGDPKSLTYILLSVGVKKKLLHEVTLFSQNLEDLFIFYTTNFGSREVTPYIIVKTFFTESRIIWMVKAYSKKTW